MLNALAPAPGDFLTPDTKHPSFKARTTGVSNPVRSPGFRASASVSAQQPAFAAGVPLDIYAFHRYTENSDRKSTRLNSSHGYISYAVFCLKKKSKKTD